MLFGEERAMPAIAQRCARRLPFRWTVEKTGVVANRAAMVVMVPALAVDSDVIVQRAIALLAALRSVLADTLPARLTFGLIPTRAFDPSTASVVSVLSDGELSTSHAWLNNPTAKGRAQSPRKWGMSAARPKRRHRYALWPPGCGVHDVVSRGMWRYRNVLVSAGMTG
jgi:hypothetical protein